jgi:DNA-binding NarL/FixJ family response regulator
MPPITVSIVEDDAETRETLEAIVKRAAGLKLLGSYCRGDKAAPCIVQEKPDVVLMDIHLPGKNGIECVAALKAALPSLYVVMLTMYEDDDLIFESLRAGASGYLLKRRPAREIVEAIEQVHAGGAPMSMPIARKVVSYFQEIRQPTGDLATLTPREHEVLALLAKGLPYKEIADRLGVSVGTVRTHLHVVYDKLHVHSRTQAVVKFIGP